MEKSNPKDGTKVRATKKVVSKKKASAKRLLKEEGFSLTPQMHPIDDEAPRRIQAKTLRGTGPSSGKLSKKTSKATRSGKVKENQNMAEDRAAQEVSEKRKRFSSSEEKSLERADSQLCEQDLLKTATVEKAEGPLEVMLSKSLLRKITAQAKDEGISIIDYVGELISEGVVLRAWEIVEKKGQMRSPQTSPTGNSRGPQGGQSRNSSGNSSGARNKKNGHRGMSHVRYQSIMDDKATFLEYVRNQERNRR